MRSAVAWIAVTVTAAMIALIGMLPSAVGAQASTSTVPCPGADPGLRLGTSTPVLLVHGFAESPDVWTTQVRAGLQGTQRLPSMSDAITSALGAKVTIINFDYNHNGVNTHWVTDQAIGPQLADCINWLAKSSSAHSGPGKVIIVAHSMGGLAVRCAVDPGCVNGNGPAADPNKIGLVITLGTPNLGSSPQSLGSVGEAICPLIPQCKHQVLDLRNTPAAEAMLPDSAQLRALPLLPAAIPVDAIAGKITYTWGLFGSSFGGSLGDAGDMVVPVGSALADARTGALHAGPGSNSTTIDCGTIPLEGLKAWLSASYTAGAPIPPVTCWHLTETTDPAWQADVVAAIRAAVTAMTTAPCTAAALASALMAADAQLNLRLLLPENWVVQGHACQSGYALAGLGGIGYPGTAAIYKQQGPSWMFVCVLGEFNTCSTEQNGRIVRVSKTLEPPPTLLQSLIDQANRA